MSGYRNDQRLVLLSGGVGGARLARGFAACSWDLTVVVNTGDDERIYGLWVSPDLDTVLYTLADQQGPQGWGLRDDRFEVMDHLGKLGEETSFRIGNRDLATNLYRTGRMAGGKPLSEVTAELTSAFGVSTRLLPASEDPVPTRVRIADEWISFQDYFVFRGHRDAVSELSYEDATQSQPAAGVMEALTSASVVVIAPSNPPLSIWPILAIPGIREAVAAAPRRMAVSPLIGGRALKGPADRVMAQLGLASGNQGVADAYGDLITDLIVDNDDAGETVETAATVHSANTRIATVERAMELATWMLELV